MNTEEFIAKAKTIHGEKYDYSKVEYKNSKTHVTIICPIHGEFKQSPRKHLNGQGCKICGRQTARNNMKSNKNLFVKKATKKYGTKYDYTKTVYTGYDNDVIVTCNIHGDFVVNPNKFLNNKSDDYCEQCKEIVNLNKIDENSIKLTEDFIKRSKEKFGDKFDYSKTKILKNLNEDIIIICPVHGEFVQNAYLHRISKYGCVQCSLDTNVREKNVNTLTRDEFILKSKEKFGDDHFDYSLIEEFKITKKCKISLICNKHKKQFKTTPYNHLKSKCGGCPECNICKKVTLEHFIEKSNELFFNKYDYSLIQNINNVNDKVDILCPIHRLFKQTVMQHLNGCGCWQCGVQKRSDSRRSTKEQFIEKAKLVHGDKYDYSLVNYKNADSEVDIICKKCDNIFSQVVYSHLSGAGCAICAKQNMIENHPTKLTKEQFIEKAKLVHGDKYDYSLVEYKGYDSDVTLICNIHKNEFKQSVSNHLASKGCPICNYSKGEYRIECYFNKNNINFKRQYRIKECKNKKPLPFDFYLPDMNILIEFQGQQHFIPYAFGSKKENAAQINFERIVKNDNIKRKYCLDNNIKLVEINYNDNIEEKLDEIFKEKGED